MAKPVKPEQLGEALGRELTLYHQELTRRLDALSQQAAKELVRRTRATAPVGARGRFRRSIASRPLKQGRSGATYVWYVKAPEHRLTHLLVHGHAKRDGGRTRGHPFLKQAVEQVLPDYERAVEEVLKDGT